MFFFLLVSCFYVFNEFIKTKNTLIDSEYSNFLLKKKVERLEQESKLFSVLNSTVLSNSIFIKNPTGDKCIIIVMGYNIKEFTALRLISYIDHKYYDKINNLDYSFFLVVPSFSPEYVNKLETEISIIRTPIKILAREEWIDDIFPDNYHTLLILNQGNLVMVNLIEEQYLFDSIDFTIK